MKPFFADGQVTIYHGDCRDVLPEIAAGEVDVLLTDPPYGIQTSQHQRLPGNRFRDAPDSSVRLDGARQGVRATRQMLFAAEAVLSPDAHAYVFCHWESWPDFYDGVSAYLPVRHALIWYKPTHSMGNFSLDYRRNYEVILYANRGARPLLGGFDSAVITDFAPVHGQAKVHPTEKPVPLLTYLIRKSCPPAGLVLDPFAGSGPTLAAARSLGLRAIGIELERRHCEAAVRRLAQQPLLVDRGAAVEQAPLPLPVMERSAVRSQATRFHDGALEADP